MGKTKTRKELLASEPWRGDETPAEDQFKDARIKVTKQPGSTPTMHLPRKKTSERKNDTATAADEPASKIDPEFLYGFRCNHRSLIVKASQMHTSRLDLGARRRHH